MEDADYQPVFLLAQTRIQEYPDSMRAQAVHMCQFVNRWRVIPGTVRGEFEQLCRSGLLTKSY